ncbi:MAG: SCO1664 family protein [Acidimicrobiales bacterium]
MSDSPFRPRPPLDADAALDLLRHAEVEILGRMPYSSNGTFLVDLCDDGDVPAQAIYKPAKGERPLWDFPDGLYTREVAAFRLSEQLGWGHVPPTVVRIGPYGIGSLQLFVPADFEEHYFTLLDDESRHEALREICAFDFVANNTDRKGGHVLAGTDGDLWAIDNGLSFHIEFKLRTVIWDFAGEELPEQVKSGLVSLLDDGLTDELAELLDPLEQDAVRARASTLLGARHFPHDSTGRRYPWPMV